MLLAVSAMLVVMRACEYQQRDDHRDNARTSERAEQSRDVPAAPDPGELPPVPSPPSPPEAEVPTFTVVGEDLYDGPDEARVRQTVVIEGRARASELRALLHERYSEIVAEASFGNFKAPTDVTITVYDSREAAAAETDGWLARLQMTKRQPPQIEIRD